MNQSRLLGAICGAVVSACTVGDPRPWDGAALQTIDDDVVGVTLAVPSTWRVHKDPVLFATHGFLLYDTQAAETKEAELDADGHAADAVARVALAYDATPAQLEELVASKLAQYAELEPRRVEVELGAGRRGVAVTGLPGATPYAVVYVAVDERVYELGLWTADGSLDRRARRVLGGIEFRRPSRTVASLGLTAAEDAVHGEPPPDMLAASRRAQAERQEAFDRAAAADPALRRAAAEETWEPPAGLEPGGAAYATCGFTAPSSLYWQLQWDATNTFYNGSWYDLRAQPGWSAMSGNYGSWWGTNFHVRACSGYYLNQYYANDWPAQYWANAYAAFSGYVEWAGWGLDGYASLGRYVVVRNGQYRSLTAHLTSIAGGITWGTWINGYSTVIGYAGDTGESYAYDDWAPHLHARVGWGESLTWDGQPYGGQSVRPLRLRCFACNDPDVAAAAGGGWYTSFWHGRWMKY